MIKDIILLLVISSLLGVIGGVLYGKKGADTFKWNEHALFFSYLVAIGLLYLLAGKYTTQLDKFVVIIVWWFMHSFVHDCFYYETRRQIDMPTYRWYFNYSKTSSARLEFPFLLRVCLASAGIVGFALYLIVKSV